MTKLEFLQEFIKYDYKHKMELAINAGKMLSDLFLTPEEYLDFMRISSAFFSAADSVVHESEVKVYNKVTGDDLSYDAFYKITRALLKNEELLKSYWALINGFQNDVRIYLSFYVLTVMSSDNDLSDEELQIVFPILPEILPDNL